MSKIRQTIFIDAINGTETLRGAVVVAPYNDTHWHIVGADDSAALIILTFNQNHLWIIRFPNGDDNIENQLFIDSYLCAIDGHLFAVKGNRSVLCAIYSNRTSIYIVFNSP